MNNNNNNSPQSIKVIPRYESKHFTLLKDTKQITGVG